MMGIIEKYYKINRIWIGFFWIEWNETFHFSPFSTFFLFYFYPWIFENEDSLKVMFPSVWIDAISVIQYWVQPKDCLTNKKENMINANGNQWIYLKANCVSFFLHSSMDFCRNEKCFFLFPYYIFFFTIVSESFTQVNKLTKRNVPFFTMLNLFFIFVK